jgi:tetratricopeptide (TPR) repeat protein
MEKGVHYIAIDSPKTLKDIQFYHPELLAHFIHFTSFFIQGYEIRLYRAISSDNDFISSLSSIERFFYFFHQNRYKNAQSELKNLSPTEKKLSHVIYWQGVLDSFSGKDKKSIAHFQEVLERNPYFAPAAYQMATYHLTQRNMDLANEYWIQTLKAAQKSPVFIEGLNRDWQERIHLLQDGNPPK